LLAEFDGSVVNRVAPTSQLASLTKENVSAVDDYFDPSQPGTSRSEWSVDSVAQEEV